MREHPPLVLGVDVGSVRRKGGFAWSSVDVSLHGQDDPSALGAACWTPLAPFESWPAFALPGWLLLPNPLTRLSLTDEAQ